MPFDRPTITPNSAHWVNSPALFKGLKGVTTALHKAEAVLIPLGVVLALCALGGGIWWASVSIGSTLKYANAGKAACAQQVNVEYLKRCVPTSDGPACALESMTRLERWYEPIAFACAQIGPMEPMVIEMANPFTYSPGVAEPPSVKPQAAHKR